MIQKEHLIIGVALVDADADLGLAEEVLLVRRADDRLHLRAHEGRGHDHAGDLAIVIRQVGGEHTVDLPAFHRFHGGVGGGIDMGFEGRGGVLKDAGGKLQVILQGAGQLPGVRVRGAEGQVVVLEADADRPVGIQPLPLLQGEIEVGAGVLQVFGVELLVVMLVFILNPVHGVIQLRQEVGALLADGEEEIGGADLPQGDGDLRIPVGIEGDEGIHRSPVKQGEGFRLGGIHLHQLDRDAAVIQPFIKEADLHGAAGDADLLPVQGAVIIGGDFLILGIDIEVVQLLAHGEAGIEHVFRALLQVGDVAHQVDLPVPEHLQELGPVALDILVFPAGIGGDLPLVLVGVPRAAAEGVLIVEGRIVPADADDLLLLLRRRAGRQQAERGQDRAKQQDGSTSDHLKHPRI